jgi:predicted RNase H-like nuclease (RuvC/YqgF family)
VVAEAEAASTAVEAANAREKHRDVESSKLLDYLQGELAVLAASAAALRAEASEMDGGDGDYRCARASAEGRLQLEQERHAQQLERLQFENEELRRATRAKTERLEKLKQQLAQAQVRR